MNKVFLIGRLAADPDIRQTTGEKSTAVARYRLAVDRRGEGTDFVQCVSFGKTAEFAEKYLKKGMKVATVGRIQVGAYTDRDGKKVYTTDIVVEEIEFCERKQEEKDDGFSSISEALAAETPFN